MLSRIVVVAAILGCLFVAPTAHADGAVTCSDGSAPDIVTRRCQVVVTTDPGSSKAPQPSGDAATPKCYFNGEEIPCKQGDAWWSPGGPCYISPQSDAYLPTDDKWEGNYPKGGIYLCANPFIHFNYTFWALTPPPGPASPADPAMLAQRAVAEMTFRAISIGMVPLEGSQPNGQPYVGLVGMPTWMWVANPTAETAGPQSRTVSAGGISVTATAALQRVVWVMGDGRGAASTVTCGAGTAYQDSYGKQDSPTCGYRYQRQGTYTVSATSYWSVVWTGGGQSGTIPLHFTSTRQVVIGEVQVITTGS